jgi:hypothetical protein
MPFKPCRRLELGLGKRRAVRPKVTVTARPKVRLKLDMGIPPRVTEDRDHCPKAESPDDGEKCVGPLDCF